MSNYLPNENRFKLAEPPQWWLQMLADYDSQLVVFPSRVRMCFVLARRRNKSNTMAELDKLDKQTLKLSAGGDGDILATNNLVFVRHLIGNSVRRPNIIQWLRDADTWAQGGADKADKLIVEAEQAQAAAKRKVMLDNIDHRARDAWRSYQARTGQRTRLAPTSRRARATQMPRSGVAI